jgi:hypothetical protein
MAALEIPPKLDGRDLAALLREARELRPFYTPEWKAAAGDAGSALLEIVAGLLAGTIERLDRAPYKHFLAFLDLLGVQLSPAQPARAPLTFLLSDGATEPVVIPARSQAAAKPSDGGDPVVFETESAFVATPARLVGVLSAVPDVDQIFDHRPDLEAGGTAALFNGVNLQEHALYLGHDDLFDVKGPVVIELVIEPFDSLLASPAVTWEYLAETEEKTLKWTALAVEAWDSHLVLMKSEAWPIARLAIGSVEQRWLRCRTEMPAGLAGIAITSIAASVGTPDGIEPDLAFANDVELALQDFHPFGRRPRLFDTFYLASREGFTKTGGVLTLTFELAPPAPRCEELPPLAGLAELALAWEYWNGTAWRALALAQEGTARLTQSGDVRFTVPPDLAPLEVLGEESLWIRARIVSGGYGAETFSLSAGVVITRADFQAPLVTSLKIGYTLQPAPLQAVLTRNNLDLRVWWNGQGLLRPFVPLESGPPALHLGFDRSLEKGPLSFFFAVEDQGAAADAQPRIEWQYLRRRSGETAAQWAALEVLDDTQGLTRSGTLQLIPPPDLAPDRRFGLDAWWLRAAVAPAAKLRGLFLNTAWAVQGETIEGEALGSGTGLPGQRFATAKAPVSGEEVWIDELGTLSDGERKTLAARPDIQVRQRTDETGRALTFEILWRPVADLALAGPGDRVYAVDRAAGLFELGGGEHGRAVPLGRDNVRASYRAGGGAQGNVPAGSITALRTTLPLVDSVANREPAAGGADTEPLERALERGPRALRHRGRAVTRSDFEVLAREASPAVARARCLGHFDEAGEETPGRVTVVIVPESLEARPFPTLALRQRVERFLAGCAPNTAGVRVVGPAYVEVRVTAELVPLEPSLAPQVEAAAFRRLAEFLHPLTGGYEGLGWEFGRRPCLSDFFPLFEALPGVDHVASLAATLQPVVPAGEPPAAATEITLDRPGDSTLAGHVLVYGGDHRLQSRMS